MELPQNLEAFLKDNRVSNDDWERASISWDSLLAIGNDHLERREALTDSAEFIAKRIQRIDRVHSVRWRVKDPAHLMEKIVRKRKDQAPKYADISAGNYSDIVTDLIGVRALHLFKQDCFPIHQSILNIWDPIEKPIAYVREGDGVEIEERFAEHGMKVIKHSDGYRSIHYVIMTMPIQRRMHVELQVRTLFEEGWSEIDHKVKYPNFSNDKLVEQFLHLFNRLAGSADEMGSYVQMLNEEMEASAETLREVKSNRDSLIAALEISLKELDTQKKKSAEVEQAASRLRNELTDLKRGSIESGLVIPPKTYNPYLSKFPLPDHLFMSERTRANLTNAASRAASAPIRIVRSGLMPASDDASDGQKDDS